MKHSQKRTFMDIEKMSSDEFKAFCRLGNKNHFTRIRKMPLQDLLFTMINRKGLTLALELRNYMKLAHPGEYSCAMKSHFRKFGNQMSGSGNHLCNYASLLA